MKIIDSQYKDRKEIDNERAKSWTAALALGIFGDLGFLRGNGRSSLEARRRFGGCDKLLRVLVDEMWDENGFALT